MQPSPRAVLTLLGRAIVFVCSWLVPRKQQLWLFMTGEGDRFADNSKYLYLYCEENTDVRNVWIGTDDEVVRTLRAAGYEAYTAGSLRGRYVMLRAGVFFETHGPIAPEYTGRARLVHLTHGNYLKTMLDDYTRDRPWIVTLAVELLFERRRQYVLTGDGPPMEHMSSMRSAPEDRMIVTGLPRNDVLFDAIPGEELGVNRDRLTEVIETARDRTVLLYAPTHREAYGAQNGTPLSELDFGLERIDQLLDKTGGQLYISPHPASTFDVDLTALAHVELLETGGDLYPFLRYCDVLLTDYSGIFYDFLLLDRPIVFYAPDLEAYIDDRGLYFDYHDHVPGPVAKTPAELATAIQDVLQTPDQHAADRQAVREQFYTDPDGKACERVYRTLYQQTGGS